MSESSSSSGNRSSDSNRGDSETERGTARPLVSFSPNNSSESSGSVRDGSRSNCCIANAPDALLASILRLIPQRERIQVASLVCRKWLNLVRSRLCQVDTTIHIFSALLTNLQQLPPQTQRVAIRTLAAFGRYAKLIVNPQELLHASRHGGPSQFSVLRALLLELREVRSINISIRCPIGARLLGVAVAGLLQRSVDTLVTLEIWGGDLADATLSAILATTHSPWERFSPQRREIGQAFIFSAAALEASVGSHQLRGGCDWNNGRREDGVEACQGMLMATAQILRERLEPIPPPKWSESCGKIASSSRWQQEQLSPLSKCIGSASDSSRRFEGGAGSGWPWCEVTSLRDATRRAMSRVDLRRSIAEIANCCCCLTAAETAFRLRRSFQHVRLGFPQLRTLAVGSWRLLQVLHCPCLEELKLASNTPARRHSAGGRHQQQEYSQFSPAATEGAIVISGVVESAGATPSALQELLLFLLRCGSNLQQLQGFYPLGAVNEALLQPVCAAGTALCGTSDVAAGATANTKALAFISANAVKPPRTPNTFIVAAMAAADTIVGTLTGPYNSGTAINSSEACATVRAALKISHSSCRYNTLRQLPMPSCAAACGNTAAESDCTSIRAIAAAQAAAANAASPAFEGDSIVAAAAALCASIGQGCRHRRHLPGRCCAVPCAWGSEGELLLVLLPRLRVAQISDFLLLGFLLLPRLEELRLPDTWHTVVSSPTAGFALLWAYLSTYGGALRALETKGMAPPLAAYLGAGTATEPIPSSVRPDEAAATKALRLLLLVHRTHPLMDPAAPSVDDRAYVEFTPRTAATAAPAAAAYSGIDVRIISSVWSDRSMEGQQHQQIDNGGMHYGCCSGAAATARVDGDMHEEVEGDRLGNTVGSKARNPGAAQGAAIRRRVLYGLKFGQLQRLQCHSSFLPYLAEPVLQCAALRDLNTEGDSDEVMWFVALLRDIDRMCVRDACLNVPRRRPRAMGAHSYTEGEEISSSASRHFVTLKIRSYVGTAFFFGPHLRCPDLRQLQVQRGDDEFDSFLVGGGAPNLQILRYQGHLFGGRGVSTPRTLLASHEVRVLQGNEEGEERAQQLLQLLDLPRSFSPLRLSPFSSLKELHVWTLDARVVVRLAFAAAAATNPPLSRAWQFVIRKRKEERLIQLQRRQQLLLQRRQVLREQEATQLLLRQRRLYDAYSARRRRLRQFCAAFAAEHPRQHRTGGILQRLAQRERQEVHNRLSRELNSMRQQLQQLQRRLEAVATGRTRAKAFRTQQRQQQRQDQRFLQGLQRLRKIRSHRHRLAALRRVLQTSVAEIRSRLVDARGEENELRRLDELEVARRRTRQQRGGEGDFGCSRSWCFWACHRAVAALSQLLPQLRVCVVQQLRGNASSLRLLLRGLPRLEIFAVEESPKSLRRKRLLRLASSLGFTVRRGNLVIPALRSNLISWGNSTVSRPFRILSRSIAGNRASASSVAAADSLSRTLLDNFAHGLPGCMAWAQRHNISTSVSTAGALPLPCAFGWSAAVCCLPFIAVTAAESSGVSTSAAGRFVEPDTQVDPTAAASIFGSLSEGRPAGIQTPLSCPSASAAFGRPGSSAHLSARALRCSVYSRKRRRESACRGPMNPAAKRRHRNPSSQGGITADDLRKDRQMARGLAEKLEEQLTS